MEKFIAVDLGSESGRVMIGRIDDNQLSLDEVHRFPNHAVNVLGHQYRNPLGMFQEIKQGIFKAAQQFGGDFISAGVNCFGLDYALLDSQGDLVGTPYCYRDSRTEGVMERVFERIPSLLHLPAKCRDIADADQYTLPACFNGRKQFPAAGKSSCFPDATRFDQLLAYGQEGE